MKNDRNKPKFRLNFFTAVLFLLFSTGVFSQTTVNETIKTNAEISPDGTLVFNNQSFNTQIKTWANNSVELQMTVKLEGDKEDVEKTLQAIKSIKCKGSPQLVTINTNFLESCNCNDSKRKLKLNNGEKVTLKSYSVENVLFIPASVYLKIENKYSDITLDDLTAKADFKLYSTKLYGGSVGGFTNFDLKYSRAFMKKAAEAVMKIYDSDIEMQACGDLDLDSKYSKLQIETVGDLNFTCYDDDVKIGKLGKIKGSAKYSDFDFGSSTGLDFDFYDSNIKTGETGDVKGQSKYSELVGKKAGKFTLLSSYDDTYSFDELESLDCIDSKYSEFRFGTVNKSVNMLSYDDNMLVDKFSGAFTGIKIESKYSEFIFTIPASIGYKMIAETKYGKLDFPQDQFVKKTYIKENESVTLDGQTKNYTEASPNIIQINVYDSKILIRN